MKRALVIQAAFFAVIAMGDDPSVRSVQAMCKRICGKALRPEDIARFLKARRQAETLGIRAGTDAETPTPHKNGQSGNATETPRKPLRAPVAKELELEVQSPSSETASPRGRSRRVAKPLPDLPDEVAIDVERLIANDAGERADGQISDKIVAQNLVRLRRAFERNGAAALRRGIDIAIGKGKGVLYAAGCADREGPGGAPYTPTLFGSANGARAPSALFTDTGRPTHANENVARTASRIPRIRGTLEPKES